MSEQFAFFDTCGHHPNATNSAFLVPDRLAGVRDKVDAIERLAAQLRAPVVSISCQCFSVQRANPDMSVPKTVRAAAATHAARTAGSGSLPGQSAAESAPEFAFVAMDATQEEVALAMESRCIVLQRYSCATSAENKQARAYDVFHVNKNANRVVRSLVDRHWIVFGGSLEFCILCVVGGLRALGAKVTVLEDVCRSTPESHEETVARIRALGADWRSLHALFPDTPLKALSEADSV